MAVLVAAYCLGFVSTSAAQGSDRTADFGITMVDAPDPTTLHNPVQYTITATNHGPDVIPAGDTVVDHSHLAGAEFVSASGPRGACRYEGYVRCELGEMAPGETATVVVQLRPVWWGDMTTRANVSGEYFDPNSENNEVIATTFVAGEPPPRAPWMGPLDLSNPTFYPLPSGGSIVPIAPLPSVAGIARKRGTRVTYRLSDPATVKFTVHRLRPQRRVRGSFAHAGQAGRNRFRFTGRVGKRALPAGIYRLVGVAIDSRGKRSRTRTARFRIAR
ncbi:MAG TPA: DUF11 domain-containing protein [Thermoleophilaceae bacterium]|nr:DUF11 domain-containing protein [Thermoleophilaceae bacterium]